MKKIMLSIGILISLFLINSVFAWWNDTWNYKQQITFGNDTSLTSLLWDKYEITIDTSIPISENKMISDCSDIRLINSSETGNLYETRYTNNITIIDCNSSTTKITFFMNRTSDMNTKTGYIYYGNTSSVSSINGSIAETEYLDTSPNGTSGGGSFYWNNRLYVIGGANNNRDNQRTEYLDLNTFTWTVDLTPNPNNLDTYAYGSKDDLFCGIGGFDGAVSDKVNCYNATLNTFTNNGTVATALRTRAGGSNNGKFLAFGGYNGVDTSDIYNSSDNTVQSTSPILGNSLKGCGVGNNDDDLVYVMRGDGIEDTFTDDIYYFNVETETWGTLLDMPFTRGLNSACGFIDDDGGFFYSLGGYNGTAKSDMWEMNVTENSNWEYIGEHPDSGYFMLSSSYKNKIFTQGSYAGNYYVFTRENYKIDLALGPEESGIADTTSPTWRDISENKPDPSTYDPSTNYGFQVNFTDETEIDTVFFEHNLTGSWSNITCSNITDIFYANLTSMGATVLNYSFIGNDTSDNQNRTDYNIFTVNASIGDCNLSSSSGWSLPYGNSTTLTCICNNVGNLYFNHVLHNDYNTSSIAFGGGIHNITCNNTLGNYTFNQDSNNLTISKTSPTLNISLNGTFGNRYYDDSDIVSYTVYRTPNGFVFLGGNLTDFPNNESSGWFTPYTNITEMDCDLNNTPFSITINSSETENYTFANFTRYAFCLRALPSGYYERWYCDPDFTDYLVKEIQFEDDTITRNRTFCEFGCSSWLVKARCDPEPFIKWIIFIVIVLGIVIMIKKLTNTIWD